MKRKRLEKILELVDKYDIETQEELIERLTGYGFEITQATISRDIRELKLTKVMSANGTYKYIVPRTPENAAVKFNSTITESILRVDWALNQVVLKTYAGMANAVAVGIDAINTGDILGCVAGDDTIIVICRSLEAAADIGDNIKHLIRGI